MADETAFGRALHSPLAIALVALFGLAGTGLGVAGLGIDEVQVQAIVQDAIEADRQQRLAGLEPKAVFIHRIDQTHESCMMDAPRLNGGSPEWAVALVRVTHYSRCDMQRISEIVWRSVE